MKELVLAFFSFSLSFICYLERKKDNTFELEILEPIKLNKTDNVSSDKEILTKRINEVIEKAQLTLLSGDLFSRILFNSSAAFLFIS